VHNTHQILAGLEVLKGIPGVPGVAGFPGLEDIGDGGEGDLLVVAGLIDVVDDSLGGVELLILDATESFALGRPVPEGAGTSNACVVIVNDVGVVVEVLVLVDGHTVLPIRGRLVALPRVSTGIADKDTLQVHLDLSIGQFVLLEDIVGKVGDVDARIALAGDVEIVLLEVGELSEEISQRTVVVLCGSGIGVGKVVVTETLAETHLNNHTHTPPGDSR
jgi:hypothetical protein